MDIHVLQNFLKVAQTLHFTRASQDAFIAQPALSRQIQHLEDTLGVKLFRRNKRNVELTEAGLYFKEEVVRLLDHWNYMKERTIQIHKGQVGDIRIGYTHSFMQSFLPQILRNLSQELPGIRTIMHELTNLEQVRELKKKELELGFATNPDQEESICGKVLATDNFVVVLPADHPVNEENYPGFSVFADESFILPPKANSHRYVATIEAICADAGVAPRIVHETPFASTGIRLVEAGMGITIEPKSGLRNHPPGVKCIELKDIPQKAELTMLWHKDLEVYRPELMKSILQATTF